MREQRAQRLGQALCGTVSALWLRWTRGLYTHSQLKLPSDLASLPYTPVSVPQASPKRFAARQRELQALLAKP